MYLPLSRVTSKLLTLCIIFGVIVAPMAACVTPTLVQPTSVPPTPVPLSPGPSSINLSSGCIDFETAQQFNIGHVYGDDVGHTDGDTVLVVSTLGNSNAVTISVHSNLDSAGNPVFGNARIHDSVVGPDTTPPLTDTFDSGQYVNMAGINLKLDFSALDPVPSKISFDYLETGIILDLFINGDEQVATDFSEFPSEIGETRVTSSTQEHDIVRQGGDSTLVGHSGQVVLEGTVKELVIGGDELSIDNLCW